MKLSRIMAVLLLITLVTEPGFNQNLPAKIIVGYWHNWQSWQPDSFPLSEVPEGYDVINISFAEPEVIYGANMLFVPDTNIYPDPQDFIADVADLQNQGKKVLISVGGANGIVNLNNAGDIDLFVNSMTNIIETYGFSGMDIDLEGASLYLNGGDNNFMNPTTPVIINMIEAIEQICDYFGQEFILSMAPETAFVQGGYSAYTSIWGAYLPVIHALREQLTYIHVQHYNTGSMFGRDGNIYNPATADFHTAMADMLIAGFTVSGGLYFDPLEPDQVAIGLPSGTNAAGSGYTEPEVVIDALNYLILGNPFGGQYQLADPTGYFQFRGLMTWSINWDVYYNNQFLNAYREYLDGFLLKVENLVISFNSNAVNLSWDSVPQARYYNIYRSDEPYFVTTGLTPYGNSTDPEFTDENAGAGSAYYYKITFEY